MSSTIRTKLQDFSSATSQSSDARQSGISRLGARIATRFAVPSAQANPVGSLVSISNAGMGLLKGIGQSVEDIAKGAIGVAADVVALPYDIAKDVASEVVNASDDLSKAVRDLGSGSAGAFASDARSVARDLFVDLPVAVGSDLAKDVKAEAVDASTLASGVLGLASLGATGGATVLGGGP